MDARLDAVRRENRERTALDATSIERGPEVREVPADQDVSLGGTPKPTRSGGPPSDDAPAGRRSGRLAEFVRSVSKTSATLLVLGLGCLAAVVIWNTYVTAPWTRDGRIRVQVASIAPEISGKVTELRVVDNQFVHKDDVLYIIDPFDFQNAVDQARTQVKMRAADVQVKSVQAERRQHLSDLATTPEEQQQYAGNSTQAQAAFEGAQAQLAQAEVNLQRTAVRSTVNGFITNLLMRVGDYARAGTSNISVIDADSYWVDGYFEETKMAHVCVGDRAEAQLMGYAIPIVGRVDTVTRGISVSDASPSTQGLPNVDPVYTWVRLAQRVPVRVRITDVPPGVPLVSGMTATVTILNSAVADEGLGRRFRNAWDRIGDVFHRPAPNPSCLPPAAGQSGAPATLPTPEPSRAPTPAQINPGLAPGMSVSPSSR